MLGPVTKPKTLLRLGPVEIAPIMSLVARMSERAWDAENAVKENAFDCFHSTRHVVFRFTTGNARADVFTSSPSWVLWRSVLLPIMNAATESYGYAHRVYPKAMLARLEAGAVIDRHSDGGGSNLMAHKIHVPLQTNPKATFTVGDACVHLERGVAYEVNNIAPHSAENFGDEDRIHLIFEVFDDEAVAAREREDAA